VVDMHGLAPDFSGLPQQALVLSLAPPDEGVKKLCAVAEWKGALNAADVTERLEQLMIKCYMDGLIPRQDQGLGPRLTTTGDKLGMLRKNELWLPVKPPLGKDWLDHLVKVCTNAPAKNGTFYSLKDSPYTWYSPWADLSFESNFRQRAYDTLKPQVQAGKTLDWKLGSNMLDPDTFTCSVPCGDAVALALDSSSGGELALSRVALKEPSSPGVGEDEEMGVYAVAKVQEWPLGNVAIDRARGNLLASLEGSRYQVPDAASFRLLVSAPGDAELWVAVLPT